MLTLHQATDTTKNILKWAAIVIVGIFILYWLVKLGFYIKEKAFPTPPPPPTVSFGTLPAIVFPQETKGVFNYQIETVSGTLPSFPDRAKVYKTIPDVPTLLNLSTARQKVHQLQSFANLDFATTEKALSETTYQYTDNTPAKRTLTMDIVTSNFTYSSLYLTDENVTANKFNGDEKSAITTAEGFFSQLSSFPNDLDEQRTTTQLLTITNGTLIPATSLSNANVIRVNFFQKALNNLPIFYAHPPQSSIYAYVGSRGAQNEVLEASFTHQTISPNFATYPIKTSEEAFEDLKKGNAAILSYDGTSSTIRITDSYLGYYLGDDPQTFLMPIIIFQGDDNFYAYVSAIKENWIKN